MDADVVAGVIAVDDVVAVGDDVDDDDAGVVEVDVGVVVDANVVIPTL